MKRIIVGITGATGSIYGVRLLDALKGKAEVHLVITDAAVGILQRETACSLDELREKADRVHENNDLFSPIASGTFMTDGMVVMPCSMKSLSGIANSYAENLLLRAADVTLKQRRPLILGVRETPLHAGHLKLMLAATEMGAIIAPPMPAYYYKPKEINDIINHTVGLALDLLSILHDLPVRWEPGILSGKER
jgi:4-hydroxy-3-polyprenylbenzoate decarboxylase